jgi:hypothetical protein
MSPARSTYTLTSTDAVYANRALHRLYWAAGATVFAMILRPLIKDDTALDITWGLWMLLEIPQALVYWAKALRAGRRDGRELTFSIREGAFVSVPEEEYL